MVGSTIARPPLPSAAPTRREIVITAGDQSSLSLAILEFHISRTIYDTSFQFSIIITLYHSNESARYSALSLYNNLLNIKRQFFLCKITLSF